MKRLLVWGAGGHGKVVADVVRATGAVVIGFVDADPAKLGCLVESAGERVVMTENELIAHLQGGGVPPGCDGIALAIGDNRRRLECFGTVDARHLPPLIHPSAVVSPSARLGSGTIVMPGAIINAAALLGGAVIVNSGAIVEHDCVVGDGAHLAPASALAGRVRIGDRAWVGLGARVLQDLAVGSDAVVGAGAVVIRDVQDAVTVVGIPASPLSRPRVPRD